MSSKAILPYKIGEKMNQRKKYKHIWFGKTYQSRDSDIQKTIFEHDYTNINVQTYVCT